MDRHTYRGFAPSVPVGMAARHEKDDKLESIVVGGKTFKGHWMLWDCRGNILSCNTDTITQNGIVFFFTPKEDTLDANLFIIPETIGQCTGLQDKNGKWVFEGDVCTDGFFNNIIQIIWERTHNWACLIVKSDTTPLIGCPFPLWQWDMCEGNGNRQLEIIGTVFDGEERK